MTSLKQLTNEETRLVEWQEIEERRASLLIDMRADVVTMLVHLVMAGLDWTQIAQSLGLAAPYIRQLKKEPDTRITAANIERLHSGLQELIQKSCKDGTGQPPAS